MKHTKIITTQHKTAINKHVNKTQLLEITSMIYNWALPVGLPPSEKQYFLN